MSRERRWLESLQGSGIRPGLDRMRALARAAGSPHRALPSTLIAGTNGKGSTAATVASILERAGVRTGLYTSPHLVSLNERWRIGGNDIRDDELDAAIRALRTASTRAGIVPTYFEALTMIAFIAFRASECEHAVLEVGMGGRLDATNIVRPLVSLITNVSLDHQEYLGNTVAKIAREKAGIIHRGSVALTADRDPAVIRVLRARCSKLDVTLRVLHDEIGVEAVEASVKGNHFTLTTPGAKYQLESPLAGTHQIANVALAVRAAEILAEWHPIDSAAIHDGVRGTVWRGRAERHVADEVTVVVDGAHNVAGAAALAKHLGATTDAPRVLVFAAMRDKNWPEMLAQLAPLFADVVVTIADPERGELPGNIASVARDLGLRAVESPEIENALAIALGITGVRTVVMAGSLYLAGAALPPLDRMS